VIERLNRQIMSAKSDGFHHRQHFIMAIIVQSAGN